MESVTASAVPPSRPGAQHDPFVTVVNISQSQSVPVPAPQAFYQNPQYHSVLEGRKLSVQVPNETSETTEEGVTFVTVLDVRDGADEGSSTAAPIPDLTSDPAVFQTAKLSGDEPPTTVSVPALTTELVTLYRLPGERLGLGLKFRGGESAQEPVQAVSVQSCAEGSPSARASCSWGQLQAGDRILAIAGRPVTALTRLQCVQLLQEVPLAVELRVRHTGKRETLVSQDSGISLGGEGITRASPDRETAGKREERPAAPATLSAPATPLVATDALAAQEAWLQAALESDGGSCSSRSSTSTIVERGVSRLPPPPTPPPQLDLASALSQFERLERELSMDSVFAAEGAEEAASVSPLPPPEVFQDRPEITEVASVGDRDTELAGGAGLIEGRLIRRAPSLVAEEDEGFHDSGGSGGASPPVRHRQLSDESREDRAALQSEEPSLEDRAVHSGDLHSEDLSLDDGTVECGGFYTKEPAVPLDELTDRQAADSADVARVDSAEVARVDSAEVARVDSAEVARVGSAEVARVDSAEVARVDSAEVARVDSEEVARVDSAEVARVDSEEVARVGSAEVARVGSAEVARVDSAEVARVDSAEVARVDSAEVARVDSAEVARVDSAEVARVDSAEVARVDSAEVARVDSEEVARVDSEEVLRSCLDDAPGFRSDMLEEEPGSSSETLEEAHESSSEVSEKASGSSSVVTEAAPAASSEVSEEQPESSSEVSEEPESSELERSTEPGTEQTTVTNTATSNEATPGDAADSDEAPTEGVLANYVPTPMPRKRAMVLVVADSDDDSPDEDFSAISDTKPSAAPSSRLKRNLQRSKEDHASMSFEVSSAAERRRKASAQEETLPPTRHSSGDTDPERPSSEDSDSERLSGGGVSVERYSRPAGSPRGDAVSSPAGRCRDSSPESPPPPCGTRQPPDGHEFPPDFGDPRPSSATPALLRPPSRFSDRGASPTAERTDASANLESGRTLGAATRGRYHRSGSLGGATSRIGEGELTSSAFKRVTTRERQSIEDLPRTGGRSVMGGRSPRGQISVKDKIALFSSQSEEQLAQSRPKLHKHKSLENDLPTRGPIRSQVRSKSDLKLSETEAARPRAGDVLTRRKRISEGRGPRFGSMLNMHISERRDSGSRTPSGEHKAGEPPKPSDENPVTPQRSRAPPSQRPQRGTSESGELASLHSDSVTSLSERPSRYREVSPGLLSERSQSLFDLGQPEKRHSFAGLQEREYSYSGHTGNLTRKVSLNSITEERKRSLSRLRGLVIPDKVDGLSKKGPVDLPTIKSKGLSSLSSSSFRSSSSSSPASSPRQSTSSRPEKLDCHQLTSPPWKAESPNIQKYSPAFKRKNISVLSPPGSSGSAFHLVSTSQLGGSSVELSRPSRRDLAVTSPLSRDPRSAGRRSEPRSPRPRLADTVEPLQRSSSLNSRPLSAAGQLRRKISDDDAADLRSRLEPADSDCGGSTLTLVNEPADAEEPELGARDRAGSIEFDHRASTSTLHESPVKELDVEEELLRAAERFHSRASDVEQQARWSATGGSPSPPRILGDDAWRKCAGERRPSAPPPGCETRDLVKLRQVTKAGMASLKQRWQHISGDGQGSETAPARPASARPEPTDELAATRPQSPPSPLPPSSHSSSSLSSSPSPSVADFMDATDSSADVTDSPADVTDSPADVTDYPADVTDSPADVTDSPTDVADYPAYVNDYPADVTDYPADVSSPATDRAWPTIQKDRSVLNRKLSTPSFSSSDLKLRERKDSVPSRPRSWVESERELGSYLGPPSTTSSQENIMHSLDSAKSPSGSTSSLLEMLTANLKSTARSRHALSVSDLRRAFERWDGRPHSGTSGHARMSSLDSSASEDGHGGGSTASPTTARDHYGSITSLASSTSLISPHELQQLIDEANQSLEESGTPSHEIIVAVVHREMMNGSIGVTLAGGADYENKEISVNKVINGSVADRDGRIKKGDRVISINGRSSKGMSHREALNTLKAPRAEVVLVLSRSRSVTPHDPSSEDQRPSISTMYSRPPKILESPMDSKSLASELAQEDEFRGPPITVTLKKEGAGLGFSLQGGKDSPLGDRPLVAKKIFTGGAADKSGLLHVRDQILAINDQDITHMARIEAWNMLKKQPDGMVRLTIRKWLTQGPGSGTDAALQSSSDPAAQPTTCPIAETPAEPQPAAPITTVSRPTALPARRRGDTRPVITGVTPKTGPMAPPAVVLPQA